MSNPAGSRAGTPATPEEWRALGRDHHLLGRRLFAVDLQRGPGRPLLALHGFPTCGWDWAPIAEQLAAGRRLIVPDLLGYGHSEKPHGYYTLSEQADLSLALLAELGLGDVEVDLLAHDMGDTVAAELLARRRASGRHPRLGRVALLNGGLLPELHQPRPIQRLLRSPLAPLVVKAMSRARFGKAFAEVFGPRTQPTAHELDQHYQLLTQDDGLANYPALIAYLREREVHRARWVPAITALDLPLLLVWGDRDPVAVFRIAEEVLRQRPATRLVRLEGIGHYPQLEAPQRVAEALVDFFR